MDALIIFVIRVVLGFVIDLFAALWLIIIFNIIGIPFLDVLSYWQCFGLTMAFSTMYAAASAFDGLGD